MQRRIEPNFFLDIAVLLITLVSRLVFLVSDRLVLSYYYCIMLYPSITKPLFEQLKQEIRENIQTGLYKPDQPIPAERRLMEIYEVSRMTVRQAIGDLVNEGILYRRHGSGTYVSKHVVDRPVTKFFGLVEELKLSREDVSIRLVNSQYIQATATIAQELGVKEHEKVFSYTRCISTKGQPILVTTSHVDEKMSKLLENVISLPDRMVIYEQLELYGYRVTNVSQSMKADLPTPDDARLLNCSIHDPVMVVHRTSYIKGAYPIIYTRAVYSQEYIFSINLIR